MKHLIKKLMTGLTVIAGLAACQSPTENKTLPSGQWRGELEMQGQQMPFLFEVTQKEGQAPEIILINGEERLEAGEAQIKGDSVIMPMHIFDTEIKAQFDDKSMNGAWIKKYKDDYQVAFQAKKNVSERFASTKEQPVTELTGKWAVDFSSSEEGDPLAVGEFKQTGHHVEGTFLTATGDYRYLDGKINGNELMLSAFDGEHAFLFKATIQQDGSLKGDFWSGTHWHETWTAVRDENISLPDPNQLTFLKEGYDKLSFSFPDLEGKKVSLEDEKYQDKVVIVQLFGTWCPNCMDETKFLTKWYDQNKDRGVEIIGLAYEQKDDFDYARKRIQKMIGRYNVQYDFLIAGTSDKEEAAKTLPMLNHVMSFPTLVFIDRDGNVRKIHTGFSGPGTGHYFEEWAEEFKLFTDKLLEEEA